MANKSTIRTAVIGIVVVAAIGGSFYGGMLYQNNVDQPLFSQYTPAKSSGGTTGRATSFFGAGAAGASSSGVAAALAVATPPGTTSGTSGGTGNPGASSTPTGGSGGTGNPTGGTGGTGNPTGGSGGGAPTSGATASPEVSGTWVGLVNGKATVKTSTGAQESVTTNSATGYYVAKTVPASSLAAGQRITVAMQVDTSGNPSVASITISPPGQLYGYVRQSQPAASSGTSGGAGGTGGFGGGFGGGFSPAGTVVSVSSGTLNLQTTRGTTSLTLDPSTPVYQIIKVTSSDLAAGITVSIGETSSQPVTAQDVVGSLVPGTVASLRAARTGGAGGGFGGAGGAGGAGGYPGGGSGTGS